LARGANLAVYRKRNDRRSPGRTRRRAGWKQFPVGGPWSGWTGAVPKWGIDLPLGAELTVGQWHIPAGL